jgi:assimilatory nitrate reductase catalytic subunit
MAVLYLAEGPELPPWEWLKARFAAPEINEPARRALLAGHAADGAAEVGPVVCACFEVGLKAIQGLIATRRAASPAEIGRYLRAGTNCGSCLPELKRILATTAPEDSRLNEDRNAL